MMERSLALKSPSIHYHLAGTKKVRMMMVFEAEKEMQRTIGFQSLSPGSTGVGKARPA